MISFTEKYAVKKSFCLHIHLPIELYFLYMGYWLNVLYAIADIMNLGIFENGIWKIAIRKTMVCSPTEISKEITIVKTKCLYNDLFLPFSDLIIFFY